MSKAATMSHLLKLRINPLMEHLMLQSQEMFQYSSIAKAVLAQLWLAASSEELDTPTRSILMEASTPSRKITLMLKL
jgi:hypothetical protein